MIDINLYPSTQYTGIDNQVPIIVFTRSCHNSFYFDSNPWLCYAGKHFHNSHHWVITHSDN